MIDWLNVAFNALWVLGCVVALSALGYASWEASLYNEKFTARLKRRPIQAALDLAGLLFCLGLAALSDAWWEKALWAILALAFGVQLAWLRAAPKA